MARKAVKKPAGGVKRRLNTIKRVDPIRNQSDIRAIRALLKNQGRVRDEALFVVGISTNLRASDLVRIQVKDVKHLKAGEHLTIKERKTKKLRLVTWNQDCVEVAGELIKRQRLRLEDPLFKSVKTGQALDTKSVWRLVKGWCAAVHLPGNYGSHTLRKTWGYQQRKRFDTPIVLLMHAFNHSSQKQTLEYLGIQDEEITDIFLNRIA